MNSDPTTQFIAIVEASSLQLQPPTVRPSDLRSHRHLLLLCLARFLALSLSLCVLTDAVSAFLLLESSSSSPILCRWWTARTARLPYLLLLSTTARTARLPCFYFQPACFHCQPLMLAVKHFLNLIGTCSFI